MYLSTFQNFSTFSNPFFIQEFFGYSNITLENILEYYLQIMDILKISYTEILTMPIKVRIALTKLLKEKENLVEDSLEMKKYQNLMDLISKGFSSVLEMLSKKGIF